MSLLDAALGYIESSPQWPIIPLRPNDKRPVIKTGTDHAAAASTDPDIVRRWLTRDHRGCFIGIPTGWPSMTIVIDYDAKHGGADSIAELEGVLGALSRDRHVRTPSGGGHLYFRRPVTPFRIPSGQGDRSKLGKLLGRNGVDVRADGGLVVVPPSGEYRWLADDDGLPELPLMWLAAIVGLGEERPRSNRGRAYKIGGVPAWALEVIEDSSAIGKGARNDVLFKLGCTLRKIGASSSDILAALERANSQRCTHPLRDAEVAKIAASAARNKL